MSSNINKPFLDLQLSNLILKKVKEISDLGSDEISENNEFAQTIGQHYTYIYGLDIL